MKDRHEREQVINIWTARIIPLVLFGVVVYSAYVTAGLLCVNYLIRDHGAKGSAIAILVVYFILFILMTIPWLRLVIITTFDPPYVPLGAAAIREREYLNDKTSGQSEEDGIGAGEYQMEKGGKNDPDSPGLELFYTKNVFVSEGDGRPIWCSHCKNWKPDRAHHDSSSGRCIKKMDHFCPWVGGPVGENNFKFFIQYTFWTALFCLHLVIVMSFYVSRQRASATESPNTNFIAIIALAGFFFLFTGSLTGTSIDLALKNLTTVEKLSAKYKVHVLAVKKPVSANQFPSSSPYREITYPLDDYQMSFMVRKPILNETGQNGTPFNQAAAASVMGQNDLSNVEARGTHTGQLQPTSTLPSGVIPPVSNHPPGFPDAGTTVANSTYNGSYPTQTQASRDLGATRTFAILTTNDGDNPWDLGSYIANFKTVMGNSVMDWFLPTTSPCSIHEDPESQFALGEAVNQLREKYCLGELHKEQTPKAENDQEQIQLVPMNGHVPQ